MPEATNDTDVDGDGDKIDITHTTKSQSNTNEENASNKDIIQNKQEGKINENTKGTNNSCKSNLGQQLSNKKDSKNRQRMKNTKSQKLEIKQRRDRKS